MSDLTPIRDLVLSGEPRVQLLPPTVKERERNRQTRRLLVLLVVLALVVVGAGMAAALLRERSAAAALAAAQQQTSDLLSAQGQYSEATRAVGLVDQTIEAQKVVTSTEVLWDQLYDEIAGYLPPDTSFDGAILLSPAPWEVALLPEGPLRAPRVATLTLTVASLAIPDAVVLERALSRVVGYADSTIYATVLESGMYYTTVVLTIDESARSGRFADDPDDASSDSATDGGSADGENAPAPSPTPTVEGSSR